MIWLVDCTHYSKEIDPALQKAKRDYFRMKSYARYRKIGPTAPVKTRVFATGLLRLATILHRSGLEVAYMDQEILEARLNAGERMPEKVAFSCVCPTVPMCADFARRIKGLRPDTEILIGGPHINLAAEETRRRYPVFDKLVVGYEHDAAQQIAGRSLEEVTGPYADYSLLPLPLSEYAINTFSTMGCPFSCNYCADGRAPFFPVSDDGQLSQMLHLLPPRNLVHFFDSVLGYSRQRLEQVCNAVKATGHRFLLSCDMRADLMTPETVKLLQEAGFVEIRMGMESADNDLLAQNGRTLMFDRFREKLEMIRSESNLYITLYTITGLPGTTRQVQEKTLEQCDLLFRSGSVDEIKNAQYVPYPMVGWDYESQGVTVLNQDWAEYDRQSFPVYRTREMDAPQLRRLYIETAQRINESWLSSLGFSSIDQVPEIPGYYAEYVAAKYLKEDD